MFLGRHQQCTHCLQMRLVVLQPVFDAIGREHLSACVRVIEVSAVVAACCLTWPTGVLLLTTAQVLGNSAEASRILCVLLTLSFGNSPGLLCPPLRLTISSGCQPSNIRLAALLAGLITNLVFLCYHPRLCPVARSPPGTAPTAGSRLV